jgi:hypothetical protein
MRPASPFMAIDIIAGKASRAVCTKGTPKSTCILSELKLSMTGNAKVEPRAADYLCAPGRCHRTARNHQGNVELTERETKSEPAGVTISLVSRV